MNVEKKQCIMTEYQASERDIRSILLKVLYRLADDTRNDIQNIENEMSDNDKAFDYMNELLNNGGEIYRFDERKAIRDEKNIQLKQDLDEIKKYQEEEIKVKRYLTPIIQNKAIEEIGRVMSPELMDYMLVGLKLLKQDIKRRRHLEKKSDMTKSGYMEKIINDYNKFGFHENEYFDIVQWLAIIAAQKWLKGLNKNNENSVTADMSNIDGEYESVIEYRDKLFELIKKIIHAIYENPEKTFPNASQDRIDYYKNNKQKIIEYSISCIAWWMYEKKSIAEDGSTCEGLCSIEDLGRFERNHESFISLAQLQFNVISNYEEFLQEIKNLAPDKALLGLYGLMNTIKKTGLRNNRLMLSDDNYIHRQYLIELVAEEIQCHKKRLKLLTREKNLNDSNQIERSHKEEYAFFINKEAYQVGSKHKPGETWPDCIFEELIEIKKRTGETTDKVCAKFCEAAKIEGQERALRKAWTDHNTSKIKNVTK